MTADQMRTLMAVLAGYWPTPVLTAEEVTAYTAEFTGPLRITYSEARAMLQAEKGRQWRPRPGEVVELVQHYRRQSALRKPPALGEGAFSTKEQALGHLAALRQSIGIGE